MPWNRNLNDISFVEFELPITPTSGEMTLHIVLFEEIRLELIKMFQALARAFSNEETSVKSNLPIFQCL